MGVLYELGSEGVMALKAVSIYFTDPGRKVEGGFGLWNNAFSDNLVLGVFLTIVLLGLGIDAGPYTVV